MPSYKELYLKSFNAMADAECLITTAANILRNTQRECEKLDQIMLDSEPTEQNI